MTTDKIRCCLTQRRRVEFTVDLDADRQVVRAARCVPLIQYPHRTLVS